jgi:diguanylate cyclase (GGDEF)-like protein
MKMQQTVLLIDDSIPIHKLVKAHLEPDSLRVSSAYGATTGLAAAKLSPDLILLDLDMPDIDGFEICRRLKADEATASIPVIFLTADRDIDNKVKGLDLGALDYISKPFQSRELRARVRASLRTKNQLDSATMVDPLTGLWNRTYLDLHLTSHVAQTKRNGSPLACIIADVGPHKALNKSQSKQSYCEIIRSVGRIILSQVRTEDIVCRCATSMLAILAMGANRGAALYMVERFQHEIDLHVRGSTDEKIGVNFGVADTHIDHESEDADLFQRASAALRQARKLGANGVCLATE